MDIGGPYTLDTQRFHVVVNGSPMKPFGKGVAPYRFTHERAVKETECTELNNKVMRENIKIVPVDMV